MNIGPLQICQLAGVLDVYPSYCWLILVAVRRCAMTSYSRLHPISRADAGGQSTARDARVLPC